MLIRIIFPFMFILLLSSFLLQAFNLSVLVYFAYIFFITYFFIIFYFENDFRLIVSKIFLPIFFSILYLFLLYIRDNYYDQPDIYLKTALSLLLSFFMGTSIGWYMYKKNFNFFIKICIFIILCILCFFIYILFSYGWSLGDSILSIEALGEYYQGIARVFSSFLIVFSFVSLNHIIIFIVPYIIIIIIIISYASIGASLGIFMSLFILLKNFFTGYFKFIVFLLLLLFIASFSLNIFLEDSKVVNYFIERILSKFSDDTANNDHNRLYLMSQGFSIWLSDTKSFLWGPGILEYSNQVFEGKYKHPHNLYANLVVFFGFFGLILSILITFLILKFTLFLGIIKTTSYHFLYYIFLYLFGLALIGGDLDQNRVFFSFLIALLTYLNLDKRKFIKYVQ